MKFTFITTTYNTKISDFQKMCTSLLEQGYKNWNIIYADDGSDSEKKVEYFKIIKQIEKHQLFVFQNDKNIGICALKDAIISHYSKDVGEYIISLDSDDYIYSNFLNNINEQITKYNPDIIKFNTLDFLTEKSNIYSIENKRKLLATNNTFRRIYHVEYNLLNSSEYSVVKNSLDCNTEKIMRFMNFASTRICGPISTIYKTEFFMKNKLQYRLEIEERISGDIAKNLDFRPALESCSMENTQLFLKASNYCYRNCSDSSVSKTFKNKQNEININLIYIFTKMINLHRREDLLYVIFTYYLYIRYMNLDCNNLFKKHLKKHIKISKLGSLSKIERIAFKFSGNKIYKMLFSLAALLL